MYQTGKNDLSTDEDAGELTLLLGMSLVTTTWEGIWATYFKVGDAHIHTQSFHFDA